MKPTVTILVCVLAAGLASAQSPSIIQNTRNTMNGVSENATAASNQALGIQQSAPASATRAPRSNGTAVVMPAKSSGAAPVPPPHKARARRVPAVAGGTVIQPTIVVSKSHAPAGAVVAAAAGSGDGENEQQVVPDAKYNANGRRDPFVSPVMSKAAGGSGCSTGKKCLEIGAINLRGVVHGETGFIAVVSNGLNKAYFLRENDPVFNGYVMKITGDSIVFQETLQDRLGKSFTREVVKKITTPAV
jgi:hypothetical protein